LRNPRFLHAAITYAPQVNVALLDQAIESEAWDWFRYTWFCYLIWTTSDTETICRKILRVPSVEGLNVLVIAVDMNEGFGFLRPEVWEWLRRDRGYGSVNIWKPSDVPSLPSLPFPPLPPGFK